MLNAACKRTDWSLSEFQTGISAAVHATLETDQLIAYTRATIIDTVTSLQGSEGKIFPMSELHELLAKFMAFWMGLLLNQLVIQLLFYSIFLKILPGSVIRSGLFDSLFFRVLRILFFLVKLIFIVTLTRFWQRLSKTYFWLVTSVNLHGV